MANTAAQAPNVAGNLTGAPTIDSPLGSFKTATVVRSDPDPEIEGLICAMHRLDETLNGFRDQLKAIRVALTMKGVIPRGDMPLVDAVLSLPQAQKLVANRAHELAQQMMSDLLRKAAEQRVEQVRVERMKHPEWQSLMREQRLVRSTAADPDYYKDFKFW